MGPMSLTALKIRGQPTILCITVMCDPTPATTQGETLACSFHFLQAKLSRLASKSLPSPFSSVHFSSSFCAPDPSGSSGGGSSLMHVGPSSLPFQIREGMEQLRTQTLASPAFTSSVICQDAYPLCVSGSLSVKWAVVRTR